MNVDHAEFVTTAYPQSLRGPESSRSVAGQFCCTFGTAVSFLIGLLLAGEPVGEASTACASSGNLCLCAFIVNDWLIVLFSR